MTRHQRLIGQKFGRLTVIQQDGKRCFCRCECGNTKWILSQNLKAGRTISCGCYQKERLRELGKKKFNRDGTHALLKMQTPRGRNTMRGVMKVDGKYTATLILRGERVFHGVYDTFEEAVSARREAEDTYLKPLFEKWRHEKKSDEEMLSALGWITCEEARKEILKRCGATISLNTIKNYVREKKIEGGILGGMYGVSQEWAMTFIPRRKKTQSQKNIILPLDKNNTLM